MEEFIPTRATQNNKSIQNLYTVTNYEAPKKKSVSTNVQRPKKKSITDVFSNDDDINEDQSDSNEPVDERRKQELEMKRYRYDVIKFGMSGFEKHKARQAKVALAISLGAKPPKNKRKNYKKLIQERKLEKAREQKKEKFASGFNSSQLLKNKKNNSKSNQSKDKDSSGILGVYGKVTKDKGHKRKSGKKQKIKN